MVDGVEHDQLGHARRTLGVKRCCLIITWVLLALCACGVVVDMAIGTAELMLQRQEEYNELTLRIREAKLAIATMPRMQNQYNVWKERIREAQRVAENMPLFYDQLPRTIKSGTCWIRPFVTFASLEQEWCLHYAQCPALEGWTGEAMEAVLFDDLHQVYRTVALVLGLDEQQTHAWTLSQLSPFHVPFCMLRAEFSNG